MGRANLRYVALLLTQTVCVLVILHHIQLIFGVLVDNAGVRQVIPGMPLVQVCIAAVIGQVCYWVRVVGMPVPITYRNIFLGHLVGFAGRLSFIFGAALFSFFFMRHLPAMEILTLDISFVWRVACLIAILFVLFCYSLELERLSLALQLPAAKGTD